MEYTGLETQRSKRGLASGSLFCLLQLPSGYCASPAGAKALKSESLCAEKELLLPRMQEEFDWLHGAVNHWAMIGQARSCFPRPFLTGMLPDFHSGSWFILSSAISSVPHLLKLHKRGSMKVTHINTLRSPCPPGLLNALIWKI